MHVWSVSHGTGGFKASFEEVSVRGEVGDYRVVFSCPISVDTVADGFETADEAIGRAKSEAAKRGIEVKGD